MSELLLPISSGNDDLYDVETEYDGRQVLKVKATENFKVAFTGLVKGTKNSIENSSEIFESEYPTENGIWIEKNSREKIEKYLNLNIKVVEESYTSKCDHLVKETMEHHDNYLGKRVKRGLFKSSTGKELNADINGAIGILRKGNAISDDQIKILRDRGDIVSPKVLNINP